MKPIFTVHAGEFLVGSYIESKFPDYLIWIPSRDTGTDLLVTNESRKKTVALQVKFSKDFLPTHMKDAFQPGIKACGWFALNAEKMAQSPADLWVFALHRLNHTELDYVILPPATMLAMLRRVHGSGKAMIQSYVWVTKKQRCWEARGLKQQEQLSIADGSYEDTARDLTPYLNNWKPLIAALA